MSQAEVRGRLGGLIEIGAMQETLDASGLPDGGICMNGKNRQEGGEILMSSSLGDDKSENDGIDCGTQGLAGGLRKKENVDSGR